MSGTASEALNYHSRPLCPFNAHALAADDSPPNPPAAQLAKANAKPSATPHDPTTEATTQNEPDWSERLPPSATFVGKAHVPTIRGPLTTSSALGQTYSQPPIEAAIHREAHETNEADPAPASTGAACNLGGGGWK